MPSEHSNVWLNRFAWFTAAATLLLICSGGMVTSKGVGLAVPDWPTTFGYNMFLFPFSKWVGGIFFEHTHRLIASTVGLLTLILAIWLWIRATDGATRWLGSILMTLGVGVLGVRTQPVHIALGIVAVVVIVFGSWQLWTSRGAARWLGVIALGAVILQGVLGGLRVTMLKDEIGIFHACLAQAFLGLLLVIALSTSRHWEKFVPAGRNEALSRIGKIAIATTIAVYIQLALGATMRHQHRDLAILDFPTAYGSWIPDTSSKAIDQINAWRDTQALSDVNAFQIWLQMVHRFGAVLVAIGAISLWSTVRKAGVQVPWLRGLSDTLVGLVLCQIALGAWTIWSNKAADIATTHVAFGALIFAVSVAICTVWFRVTRPGPNMNPLERELPITVAAAR